MKYYSEITKNFYTNEEECLEAERILVEKQKAAEAEKQKIAAERKARAEEIEEAKEAFIAARNRYNELLTKFCEDYGSYHYSVKNSDSINDFVNSFFHLF